MNTFIKQIQDIIAANSRVVAYPVSETVMRVSVIRDQLLSNRSVMLRDYADFNSFAIAHEKWTADVATESMSVLRTTVESLNLSAGVKITFGQDHWLMPYADVSQAEITPHPTQTVTPECVTNDQIVG